MQLRGLSWLAVCYMIAKLFQVELILACCYLGAKVFGVGFTFR